MKTTTEMAMGRKKCPINQGMKCEECVFLVRFNNQWSCNYARCYVNLGDA